MATAPAPAPAHDPHSYGHSLLRSSHAIASAISWGLLLPALVFRENYLPNPLPRSEILLKVALYAIAAAAAALGFWASAVTDHHHKAHLGIAIVLLVLGFVYLLGIARYNMLGVQVLSVMIAALAIADVLIGFQIHPRPHRVWRVAYLSLMATIVAFAACCVFCLHCCFQGGILCFLCFREEFIDEEDRARIGI